MSRLTTPPGRSLVAIASASSIAARGRSSEATATRLIDRIKQDCEPLRYFPLSAPARENFAPGLRVCFSGNFAIYFIQNEHELVIVRVVHGVRDSAALAEHGGFAHDDTNVMMLVSNPYFKASTVTLPVETRQVAPTVLAALGFNPEMLNAVQTEGTQVLPGLNFGGY